MKTSHSFLSILLLTASVSSAAEESISCPARLYVSQTFEKEAPPGWTAYGSTDDHSFMGISFFAGPPDQKVLLAPSKEESGKRKTATWVFPSAVTPYWVACEYAGTSAMLARPLAADVSACVVEYDSQFASPVVRNWRCSVQDRK